MIRRYRKTPIVIEAVQWTGDNMEEIAKFLDSKYAVDKKLYSDNFVPLYGRNYRFKETYFLHEPTLFISTLEGEMKARVTDFIIKGIDGEYYPCRQDIFNKTYDVVTADEN